MGCSYDNGGVNVGPAGTGGTTATTRPDPEPSGTGGSAGSAAGGTGGGSVGISSVPPAPVPMPDPVGPADAAAPTPAAATDAGVDAAPTPAPQPQPADAAPPGAQDPFCPASPDLAVCLRFESRLQDESPNHLPVGDDGARFAAGMVGYALDGHANTRVTIPESPALDAAAITIETWVRARNLGRRMAVVENPVQYRLVVLPSGSVMCSGRGGYALRTEGIAPDRWTHLACTFDSTTVTLWIDGQMVLQRPAGPVATEGTMGVRIGWEDEATGGHFDGLIDNLRIWRTVRAPDMGR